MSIYWIRQTGPSVKYFRIISGPMKRWRYDWGVLGSRVARWCQIHNFIPKSRFGYILRAFKCKMLVHTFYGHLVFLGQLIKFWSYLVYFVVIWYTSSRFGPLYQEKSGNLAWNRESIHVYYDCSIYGQCLTA
jgi:hypothetical protein